MRKILLIEDEDNIRKILAYDLTKAGYDVEEAEDGKVALEKGLHNEYDLMIIDWMLPYYDGIQLITKFREANIDSVFVMLTAKGEEEDLLTSFEAGADDYINKPFSPKELMARINAHLKRTKRKESVREYADLRLDEKRRVAYIENTLLELTKKEYELLEYYILNNNIVLSRDKILNDLWGFDYDGDTRIVDVHTFKLRSKLKESKANIKSSRGIGYILEHSNE